MAVRARKKKHKRVVRKAKKAPTSASKVANRTALWNTYRDLQKKADAAWKTFHTHVKRKASPSVLLKDHNNLLLLLGECHYMANECARLAASKKSR